MSANEVIHVIYMLWTKTHQCIFHSFVSKEIFFFSTRTHPAKFDKIMCFLVYLVYTSGKTILRWLPTKFNVIALLVIYHYISNDWPLYIHYLRNKNYCNIRMIFICLNLAQICTYDLYHRIRMKCESMFDPVRSSFIQCCSKFIMPFQTAMSVCTVYVVCAMKQAL